MKAAEPIRIAIGSGAFAHSAFASSRAPVEAARRRLARLFRQAGLDTPELDARVLIAHALGLDHTGLAAAGERLLTSAEEAAVSTFAGRRLGREPVARIIGTKEFWSLRLKINPATLVPRPESETIVTAALEAIAPHKRQEILIADLGTGSGALLLSLLSELPQACGVGTDTCVSALRCAQENARSLGFAHRTRFVACDYGSALVGGVDLVVANPPYVRRAEIETLSPEVRLFDPPHALDGGDDGLAGYRAIAADARRLLPPAAALVLEIGDGQLAAATDICAAAGLVPSAVREDLAGAPRALVLHPAP
jgi:release factor glutamine methyltransferase